MLCLPSRRRRHTCFAYVSIPLLISFCRLAATRANKVSRPCHYSLTVATGSKRPRADSDSLLCHVGLWRTSRLKFGCASVCEHGEINVILIVSSAHSLYSRPPCTFSGRADNACTNLLGFFVRYVRTRGSMRLRRVQNRRLSFYPLPHALATHYFLRLTRARRGGSEGGRRESSLLTFGTFGHAKVRENKTLFMFLLRKLTSRKTSEFHYISLVRKGADYLP